MHHSPEPVGADAAPTGDPVVEDAAALAARAEPDDPQVGGLALRLRPPGGWSDDRGDVPGWVLVTLMTAGLVIALWAVAGPALAGVFESAIERVTSFGG
ncbi:hypothetical protein [Actinotalea solisilvae]|uniref:hypothetical protein n=1 Tax=Actinotalea solisilvae TaxID=2072922 RepID=UPI0018F19155|nr:hypothetical protein [Actinotalea solisilvae]